MISSVQSWPYGFEEELQKLHPKINNIEKKKKVQEILWCCWIQIWYLKRSFRCEKGRSGKIAHFPSLCALQETQENSQRPSAGVRYSPDSKRNGASFSKEQLTSLCQAEGHELRQRQAASKIRKQTKQPIYIHRPHHNPHKPNITSAREIQKGHEGDKGEKTRAKKRRGREACLSQQKPDFPFCVCFRYLNVQSLRAVN